MSTQTPNMGLYLPTIAVDSGLTWEQNINANSSILDGHNHSNGSGNQIGPSGININADLPFNINNATALRSVQFNAQAIPLALAADVGCMYVSGVDLYYNDVNGVQIQITTGGSVNATSSGISSGTASASFVASTLVVNSASNTPANIKGASLLLGNTGVSGSNYLQLSPPSALALNYSITLPALPGSTSFLTMDSSGTMAASTSISGGITGSMIASATVTGSNIASATITGGNIASGTVTPANLSSTGTGTSGSSGSFSTSSTSYVSVTNLSVALSLSSSTRVVVITLQSSNPNPTPTGGVDYSVSIYNSLNSSSIGYLQLLRNGTPIQVANVIGAGSTNGSFGTPSTGYTFYDIPGGTSPTYSIRAAVQQGAQVMLVSNIIMVCYAL